MKQARWQRATEWPLILASVVFLITYAWQVVGTLTGPANTLAEIVLWITWALFLADYVINLALVDRARRWRWFWTHLFDLAVVVLPMLRPLRILRLVTLLRVLQRTAGNAIRGRIIVYVSAASALLVVVASLAILDAERGQDSSIDSFGDALWWSVVTVNTVGYGDLAPVTTAGRFIAAALMLGGIALLGVITATLASWIVEKVAASDAETGAATVRHIRSLEQSVRELRELIEQRGERAEGVDATAPPRPPHSRES